MKKLLILLCAIAVTAVAMGCLPQDDNHSQTEMPPVDLSNVEYSPVQDPETFTVQGEAITIDQQISIGDTLVDVALDKPVEEFDKIQTMNLSELEGLTLIYSVPSLDTPVCTLQTKQIESAAKKLPNFNFVILSHDTPFALERFCGANGIDNILTLSDVRTKKFARQNGLYMNEYNLMTRALVIINNELEVLYVDYADEVTSPVDLFNAFAFLQDA